MTIDLQMLAWTAALTAVLWVPYILAHVVRVGPVEAFTYRADGQAPALWASRARAAHANAVENLIPFAVLVLVAHISGAANEVTAMAAVAYFWLRVVHYFIYIANIPLGRTLTFALSWAAMIAIFFEIVA